MKALLIAGLLSATVAAQEPPVVPVQMIPITLQLKIEPLPASAVVTPPAAAVTPPDYTALLQSILASTKTLLDVQTQQLALEKDTNAQLTAINKTWVQNLSAFGTWCAKYVAPAAISMLATLKATGKL